MIFVALDVLDVELPKQFEIKKNTTMTKDFELQIVNWFY